MWTTQFIIAVSSSVTTALLLYMLRQFVKLRKSAVMFLREHRYLIATMNLVLVHLGMESLVQEFKAKS